MPDSMLRATVDFHMQQQVGVVTGGDSNHLLSRETSEARLKGDRPASVRIISVWVNRNGL